MSRLLNVVLLLALIALGVYHIHVIQVSKDSDRLIDLSDRPVPLPQDAAMVLYYRGTFPYLTGVITADGYRIFLIDCDTEDTVCRDSTGNVIASIQETALLLPRVKPEDIEDGKVRCQENICTDYRRRVVGSDPR